VLTLHKRSADNPFPSRPITSAVVSPTRCISDTLVAVLAPLIADDGWTLSSSFDFIRLLETNAAVVGKDTMFLALDVEALYPSMDIRLCVKFTVERFCEVYGCSQRSPGAIAVKRLLWFLLTDNYFVAPGHDNGRDVLFRQVSGIAMGISVAVILANIYVRRALLPVFHRFAKRHPGCILWARGYVDDISAAVQLPEAEVDHLVAQLNGACPGLRLTCSRSTVESQFLDVVVSKGPRAHGGGHRLECCWTLGSS